MFTWRDLRVVAERATIPDVRDAKKYETAVWNVTFKSRAERRIALTFSAMNIRWGYEVDQYHLPSGEVYVPDFYLPDLGTYVEVKSGTKAERTHKPIMLQRLLDDRTQVNTNDEYGLDVLVIWDNHIYDTRCKSRDNDPTGPGSWCRYGWWARCGKCLRWQWMHTCTHNKCRYEGCESLSQQDEDLYGYDHQKLAHAASLVESKSRDNDNVEIIEYRATRSVERLFAEALGMSHR